MNWTQRPHFVFFNPDQFRADALGHLGNPASRTPVLDSLVDSDAVSFSRAYCQNPVCTPSRCSFMSGWYPHVRGHRTMHFMMQKDEPVLLRTLKSSGYSVWWGGKNDLVPGQDGWDEFCDVMHRPGTNVRPDTHVDQSWRAKPGEHAYHSFFAGKHEHPPGADMDLDVDMDAVLAACEHIRTASLERPLCVYLPLINPHPPYAVDEPYYSMIDRSAVPPRIPTPASWVGLPSLMKGIASEQRLDDFSDQEWNELRAVYLGMCARLDAQLGMIIDALRQRGIYDNTALFFLSDHSDFTGDYGLVEKTQNTFQECLTRVPFIVKPPSQIETEPGVRDSLVELIDFPATVEALAGLEPRHTHFGKSVVPLLTGSAQRHRDAVFCEGGRLPGEHHTRERQTAGSGTLSSLYWPRAKWQIGDGPEHGKAVMVRTSRYKYVRRLTESDELYDLECDPEELMNRIDDPAMHDVLQSLKDRLLTFFLETGDVVPFEADKRSFVE